MKKSIVMMMTLAAMLLLAACGGATPAAEPVAVEEAEVEVMEESMDDEMMEDESGDEMMADDSHSDDTMMEDESGDEIMADDSHSDDTMMEDESGDEMMADDSSDESMMDEASDGDMMEDSSDDAMMEDDGDAMMAELPAWQTLQLTNAATGETFAFADFKGQTVFVEPMATWCSNCSRQLGNVAAAKDQLGDDVVFIALSVETSLDNATLAQYAADRGYPFLFAVATPDMITELAAEFGQSVANPPATPHFIISPDGSFSDLATGLESTDQIVEEIEAARG